MGKVLHILIFSFLLLFLGFWGCKKERPLEEGISIEFIPPPGKYIYSDYKYIEVMGKGKVEKLYWSLDKPPVPGTKWTHEGSRSVTIPVSSESFSLFILAVGKNEEKLKVEKADYEFTLPPRINFSPPPGIYYKPKEVQVYCYTECELEVKVFPMSDTAVNEEKEEKKGEEEGEKNKPIQILKGESSISVSVTSSVILDVSAFDKFGQLSRRTAEYRITKNIYYEVSGCRERENDIFICDFPDTVSIYSDRGVKIYVSEDGSNFNIVSNPYYALIGEPKVIFIYLEVEDVRTNKIPIIFVSEDMRGIAKFFPPSGGKFQGSATVFVRVFPEGETSQISLNGIPFGTCPPDCVMELEEGLNVISADVGGKKFTATYLVESKDKTYFSVLPQSGEYNEPFTFFVVGITDPVITICGLDERGECYSESPTLSYIELSKGEWVVYVSPRKGNEIGEGIGGDTVSRFYSISRNIILDFTSDNLQNEVTGYSGFIPFVGIIRNAFLEPETYFTLEFELGYLRNIITDGRGILHICSSKGYIALSKSGVERFLPNCSGIYKTQFSSVIISSGNSIFSAEGSFNFALGVMEKIHTLLPVSSIYSSLFSLITDSFIALSFTGADMIAVYYQAKEGTPSFMLPNAEEFFGSFGSTIWVGENGGVVEHSNHPRLFMLGPQKFFEGEKVFVSPPFYAVLRKEENTSFIDIMEKFGGESKPKERYILHGEVKGIIPMGDFSLACLERDVMLLSAEKIMSLARVDNILGCGMRGNLLYVITPRKIYVFNLGKTGEYTKHTINAQFNKEDIPFFDGYSFLSSSRNLATWCDLYECVEAIEDVSEIGEVSFVSGFHSGGGKMVDRVPLWIDTPIPSFVNLPDASLITNSKGIHHIFHINLASGNSGGGNGGGRGGGSSSGGGNQSQGGITVLEVSYSEGATLYFLSATQVEFSLDSFSDFVDLFSHYAVSSGSRLYILPYSMGFSKDNINLMLPTPHIFGGDMDELGEEIEDLAPLKNFVLVKVKDGYWIIGKGFSKKFISDSAPLVQDGFVPIYNSGKIEIIDSFDSEKIWERSESPGILWMSFKFPYLFVAYEGGLDVIQIFNPIPEKSKGFVSLKLSIDVGDRVEVRPCCEDCSTFISWDGRDFRETSVVERAPSDSLHILIEFQEEELRCVEVKLR